MSSQGSSNRPPRLLLATLLFSAAALTGCNCDSGLPSSACFPNLLGFSTVSSEPITTLRANSPSPLDPRHRAHLRQTVQTILQPMTRRSL